jgi:arginine deiminase
MLISEILFPVEVHQKVDEIQLEPKLFHLTTPFNHISFNLLASFRRVRAHVQVTRYTHDRKGASNKIRTCV